MTREAYQAKCETVARELREALAAPSARVGVGEGPRGLWFVIGFLVLLVLAWAAADGVLHHFGVWR